MPSSLNKEALVNIVHDSLRDRPAVTRTVAEEAVTATLSAITEALQMGQDVRLAGLGTLSIHDRAARTGVNPRTGEAIDIPAKKVVRFSAAKAVLEALNA